MGKDGASVMIQEGQEWGGDNIAGERIPGGRCGENVTVGRECAGVR